MMMLVACRGDSLFEIVTTLLIFSLSIVLISPEIFFDLGGMNKVLHSIAEIYAHDA